MRCRLVGVLSCVLVIGGCQSSTMTAAKLYEKQGDVLKAKEQWLNVLEVDPDNMEAHFSLGKIYGGEGEYEKMVTSFDIASGSEFQNEIDQVYDAVFAVLLKLKRSPRVCNLFVLFISIKIWSIFVKGI